MKETDALSLPRGRLAPSEFFIPNGEPSRASLTASWAGVALSCASYLPT
jgi:hypothetical protein